MITPRVRRPILGCRRRCLARYLIDPDGGNRTVLLEIAAESRSAFELDLGMAGDRDFGRGAIAGARVRDDDGGWTAGLEDGVGGSRRGLPQTIAAGTIAIEV